MFYFKYKLISLCNYVYFLLFFKHLDDLYINISKIFLKKNENCKIFKKKKNNK